MPCEPLPLPLPLSVAFWDYDRTLPIADGRVPMAGCAPACTILPPHVLFPRAFGSAEFDVSELSLSRHAQAVARGDSRYVGVPVFPSRAFRHASIYVRTDRGIDAPGDLRGRRMGLRNYDDTAAVVVRGLLRDAYGVEGVTWVVGEMEAQGGAVVPLPVLHAPVAVERLAAGATLDAELAAGRLDGVVALLPPPCVQRGDPLVRRLFPDWRAAEQAYARAGGLFPIMHLVGVRASLVAAHPWLVGSVAQAFTAAKDMAVDGLSNLQACKATLPWAAAEQAATRAVLGQDYWPYGLEPNRAVLAATLRHLRQDGLLPRDVTVEELFA